MKKIDWKKIGSITLEVLQSSGKPLLTGVGMIGLSLVCKKLDIPYQVLFDPNYMSRSRRSNATIIHSRIEPFVIMPENATEAAINAIVSSMNSYDSDYYILQTAHKIYDMLSESTEPVTDRTKTHAIMAISNLSKMVASSYYKKQAADLIAKIGSGDY